MEAKRSKTVCAQAARAGLGATALVARTRLVTPVETAENKPSILIKRQIFNLKLKHNHLYHSFRVGWFSLACVQTPLPRLFSKNRTRGPFSYFYWGEVGGGGGLYTGHFALLWLKKNYTAIARRKSIPIQPDPAYIFRIFSKRGAYLDFPARSNSA